MKIRYANKKIKKILENIENINKTFGNQCAMKIITRLKELRAAKTLKDLWPPLSPPARCHELKLGTRKGKFHISVDVKHPYRLIFAPDHNPIPILPDGGLDWECVTAITIIEIGNTHE